MAPSKEKKTVKNSLFSATLLLHCCEFNLPVKCFFGSKDRKLPVALRLKKTLSTEFAIAAPADGNRKDQLLSSLFPERHPARTFTWGNLQSLREELADDEKLHQAAHEFRRRHYSAHRMTLAVQVRRLA